MYFRHGNNNRGVALVTALLMMVISLAIILAALYMITRGTTVSNLTRQYHSEHDAAYGGADFVTKELIPKVMSGLNFATIGNYNGLVNYPVASGCFANKLRLATVSWGCSDNGLNLDPANGGNPDIQLTLAGTASSSSFNVLVKIVDTVPGNSSTSGTTGLNSASAVAGGASGEAITPMHIPYSYRVEVQAQRTANPLERANLTGVYLY